MVRRLGYNLGRMFAGITHKALMPTNKRYDHP